MCTRAGRREGHFLKMVYGIWSTGLGVDEDFDQLRDDTANLLLGERSGAHGDGRRWACRHPLRVVEYLGVAEYTLEKYSSAHRLLKEGLVAVALSSLRT